MNKQGYFYLNVFKLNSLEEWTFDQPGLCLLFPTDGIGQFVNRSGVKTLLPGDLLVFQGGLGCKLCVGRNAKLTFNSFSLCMENLLPLFAGKEIFLLHEVAEKFKVSKLFPASTTVAKKCHQLIKEVPPQMDLEHRVQMLRIAATVLNGEFAGNDQELAGLGHVERRIVEVFEQLTMQQMMEISADELARKIGCGRRHLNRLFQQCFGFSVGQMKMEMRLQHSISLLRDENCKVIDVAEKCGFNHLGLFNSCFKRRFHVSPGQWRKQAMHSESPISSGLGQPLAFLMLAKGLSPMAIHKYNNGNGNTQTPPAFSQLNVSGSNILPSSGTRNGGRAIKIPCRFPDSEAARTGPVVD